MYILPDTLNFRVYSPGDEEKIVSLLKSNFLAWRRLPSALDNWKWKYLNSPLKSFVVVCTDADEIVGVVHSIILPIKLGDSIFLCSYADDGAVSSKYRGRGIYAHIRKLMNDYEIKYGVDYRYLATENPIIVKFETKDGYKPFPFYISHMVKVYDVEKFLNRNHKNNLFMNFGIRGIIELNKIGNAFKSKSVKSNDFSIVKATEFDNRTDAFWEKAKKGFDYIVEKKVDYLNWKKKRPGRNSQIKMAIREDEIVGFSILSISENEDYVEGTIRDLLVTPNRVDIADSLIEDACRYFDDNRVDTVYYPITRGHPYQKLAMNHEFIDVSMGKNTLFYYKSCNLQLVNGLVDKFGPTRVQLNYF